MEKNYAERVMEIKNEILKEIRELLGCDKRHAFKDKFFVHYVEGEVAATDICHAVEVWFEGGIVFCVSKDENTEFDKEEVIEAPMIFNYDVGSFIDILDRLKKELREEKLAKLREIVKNAGGEIRFTDNCVFDGIESGEYIENCYLSSLRISGGKIVIKDIFEGSNYENDENFLPTEEIDRIIGYAEKESEKNFFLTDEQTRALHEFIVATRNLHSAGVSIIRDNVTDNLYFVNGERVDVFMNEEHVVPVKDITDIVKSAPSLLSICDAAFYFNEERIFAKMLD